MLLRHQDAGRSPAIAGSTRFVDDSGFIDEVRLSRGQSAMSVLLNTIDYHERPGQPLEWTLETLSLGPVNLLVGKNATGKTRALNIIWNLSRVLLRDQLAVQETGYDVAFNDNGTPMRYVLRSHGGKVTEEKFWYDGDLKLERNGPLLKLKYEKEGGKFINHEPSDNEVSAVARKDKHQHPSLLSLRSWAEGVRHYTFGSPLGKDTLALQVKAAGDKPPEFDDCDESRAVAIFLQGVKEFEDEYRNSLLADMRELGYPLSEIAANTAGPYSVQLVGQVTNIQPAGELRALGVREDGVGDMYFQDSISQGMFRALSVLIQVTYSQMSGRANCILVDDVGEGLDYDRSSLFIEMLRRKAQHSKFQLIMATNDQFVMNRVPLDEWSVLQRKGSKVSVRNIHNSKKVFEDFKFVGLSNFAFFEMDFANAESEASRQLSLEGINRDE
jgi:hypothetical protein